MNLDQLFQDFRTTDLEWLIPIGAGFLLILGGILIALVRGVSAGVVAALLFGCLLTLSPVLLDALERQPSRASPQAAELAQETAALVKLNNAAINDLSRVVTTVRTAIEGLIPEIAGSAAIDPAAKARLDQAMAASAERLDAIAKNVAESQVMVRDLDATLDALGNDTRRRRQNPR